MANSPLIVLSRICVLLMISHIFVFSKAVTSQFTNCSITQDKYTTNGSFHGNLKIVLSNLTFVANTSNSGFHNFTFGSKKDVVFGLYLCRGDITPEECSSCVGEATGDIMDICPNRREVIAGNPECILRYANRNIFSKEEEEPSEKFVISFSPGPNATLPPMPPKNFVPFNVSKELHILINKTAFGDYSSPSVTRFFATREEKLTGGWYDQVLYSLAQCTPDISALLCHKCLKQAINILSAFGSISTSPTEVYLPSCWLQFNVEKFFRDSNDTNRTSSPPLNSPLPPTSSPPQSDLREPIKSRRSLNIVITVAVPSGVLALLLLFSFCFFARSRARSASHGESITTESLQYDISTIKTATSNFSTVNKLGQGGYGAVYKGRLQNGQEIVVKKLPSNSAQGIQEFKNDALVIARLQHRNLVRLLGFCVTDEEKLLIYEFLPNSSLDSFLFDPEKRKSLVWETRYKTVEGIAKGLLYLHEHSQYKIVHEDLKPGNILLDKDMTPKISDFGTEKFLRAEYQIHGIGNKVGTCGYMAPEYIISGEVSVKSNVFSFGVIVLEIVSGQRSINSSIHGTQQEEGLIHRAWRLWNGKEPLAFVDEIMPGKFSEEEVTRCIHIGLLCVQEDAERRPSIASIISLLNSHSSSLPDLAPGEGYYKTDNSSSSLGLQYSTHTYSGMQDSSVLSPR